MDIDQDIAIKTFNEVNQFNDINKVIDLNCLDPKYAEALLNRVLNDLAAKADEKYQKVQREKSISKNQSLVLQVLCGASQVHEYTLAAADDQKQKKYKFNSILGFVNKDAKLDHFYVPNHNKILIRVDEESKNNLQY